MKKTEIEHMWKVASNNPNHDTNWHDPVVVAFAQLVAQKEREECAKLCDAVAQQMDDEGEGPTGNIGWVSGCADAIRARGQA
jgi:thioesterase domain-containing protein